MDWLKHVNMLVRQDVENQKDQIQLNRQNLMDQSAMAKNMYDVYRQEGLDAGTATLATVNLMKIQVANKLDTIASTSQDQAVIARSKAAAAQVRIEIAKTEADIKSKEQKNSIDWYRARTDRMQVENQRVAAANKAAAKAAPEKLSEKHTLEMAGRLALGQKTAEIVRLAKEARDGLMPTEFGNRVAGSFMANVPGLSTDQRANEQRWAEFRNSVRNDLFGASLTDSEKKSFAEQVPDSLYAAGAYDAVRNWTRDTINALETRINIAQKSGYDTSAMREDLYQLKYAMSAITGD
jgi:hypothetical protein